MKDLSSSQISQRNPIFWQLSTLKHFIWYLLMLRPTKFFLVWAKQPLQRIDKIPGSYLLSQQVKFSLRNTLISKNWQIIQKSKARYLSRPFPSPRDGTHVPSPTRGGRGFHNIQSCNNAEGNCPVLLAILLSYSVHSLIPTSPGLIYSGKTFNK